MQVDATGELIPRDLVVAYVAGDRSAFSKIFARLKRDLFYQVQRFFPSPFDQEEAFQEVWLQIYRMRQRFDVNRHTEFAAWARQVSRNRCIDLLKAKGRRPEVPMEPVRTTSLATAEPTQHRDVIQRQVRQAVQEVVERLEPEQREFFELCFVQELSHETIARELSITVRRSKYLKKKLLARLVRSVPLRRIQADVPR